MQEEHGGRIFAREGCAAVSRKRIPSSSNLANSSLSRCCSLSFRRLEYREQRQAIMRVLAASILCAKTDGRARLLAVARALTADISNVGRLTEYQCRKWK